MRVLPLTSATQGKVLASRRNSNRHAERAASKIVEDVRRRGDAALFKWTKKFDRVAVNAKTVWVSPAEFSAAQTSVAADFLGAIRAHRAQYSRICPTPKTGRMEHGDRTEVRAGQIVQTDRVGRLLSPWQAVLAGFDTLDDVR